MEPFTKFVPVSVRRTSPPPTYAVDGEILVKVGTGLVTVKFEYPLVPKLGDGLATLSGTVPPVAIEDAATVVVIVMEFTKVAACQTPLTDTVEPDTKFLPVSVSVNAAPPALTEDGERLERVGARLFTVRFKDDVEPPLFGLAALIGT